MESLTNRVDPKKTADYFRDLLDSPEVRKSINTLKEIVKTCYGPHGKIKMLQNCSGGHMTLTSMSRRLFSTISLSKPVLKLLVGSIQGHLVNYGDGGLFAALMALYLIDSALDLHMQRHLIVDIFDLLLRISVDYLKSADCGCKRRVELGNLTVLLKLVKSIIGTKPVCGLYGSKLDFVCNLLVEAFLKSLPDVENQELLAENILFVPKYGSPVTKSRIFDGVLLDTCEREVSLIERNKVRKIRCNDGNMIISVAVINVSMSGDSEDFATAVVYEVESNTDIDSVSTERLHIFAGALVETGVGVVVCQKVIHPSVKKYLREAGVVAVDRLGLAMCQAIKRLTGAHLISAISPKVDRECFGSLSDISVVQLDKKSYLLLTSKVGKVITVLLYNTQDEAAAELKVLSESTIQCLHRYLLQPEFLMGAGCWQTHMAAYLRYQVLNRLDEMMTSLSCTQSQLMSATESFAHSLELCAIAIGQEGECHMTDAANQHLWRAPAGSWDILDHDISSVTCSCGEFLRREVTVMIPITGKEPGVLNKVPLMPVEKSVSKETEMDSLKRVLERPVILDLFSVQMNALQTAVMTASAVLGVNQYIHDTN